MFRSSKRPSWLNWIAVLAILFNALAPSVSHAWLAPKASSLPHFEICTSLGPRLLTSVVSASLPVAADQQQGDDVEAGRQCPYCHLQAVSPVPPPSVRVASVRLASHPYLAPLYLSAPAPLFIWSATLSRGPPVHA